MQFLPIKSIWWITYLRLFEYWLVIKLKKDRESREELERVRQELYLEEQEQLARNHERIEMERKLRQRIDLQKQHQEQIQFKQLREQAERDEENRIKEQMLEKFAIDDKLEQMNAQRRRMKQLEHKKAVEQLLEVRRQELNAAKKRELDERVEAEKLDEYRRQIIEEERIRLLKEHATKLLGYLPKGVIRDSKDLDILGDDFKRQYQKRQVDFFGDDKGWSSKWTDYLIEKKSKIFFYPTNLFIKKKLQKQMIQFWTNFLIQTLYQLYSLRITWNDGSWIVSLFQFFFYQFY